MFGAIGGTGGTDTFSTVFTGSKSATKDSVPINTGSLTVDTSGLSAGATTLSTPQIPSHSHPQTGQGGGQPSRGRGSPIGSFAQPGVSTGSAGGGGSHSHSLSGISLSGSLTSTIAASVPAMNLKFVDSIIATKD